MQNTHDPSTSLHNPVSSFFLVLIFAFLGFIAIGPFIGLLFTLPFFGFDLMQAADVFAAPIENPQAKYPLLVVQGVSSLIGFVIIPYLYLKWAQKKSLAIFFHGPGLDLRSGIMIAIIVVSFMFVNSIFIDWNANLELPGAFGDFARKFEDRAQELTKFLTDFDNAGQFLVGIMVIALIPAVGEELLFRGLLQNLAHSFSKNIHVAIALSALLFSAFHLQFYGFVPRFLLGVLFGYLYYWSGNLAVPILAHFVNNAFTLLMVYLYHQGIVEFDIESSSAAPLPSVILFTVITIGLLFLFKKYSERLKQL